MRVGQCPYKWPLYGPQQLSSRSSSVGDQLWPGGTEEGQEQLVGAARQVVEAAAKKVVPLRSLGQKSSAFAETTQPRHSTATTTPRRVEGT
jgi:hypothetical protein